MSKSSTSSFKLSDPSSEREAPSGAPKDKTLDRGSLAEWAARHYMTIPGCASSALAANCAMRAIQYFDLAPDSLFDSKPVHPLAFKYKKYKCSAANHPPVSFEDFVKADGKV